MNHLTDDLNPRFVYFSNVHFDELDPMKMLHNSRFAAHVERAITTWYTTMGKAWQPSPQLSCQVDRHAETMHAKINVVQAGANKYQFAEAG